MNSEAERKAFIRSEANWKLIDDLENVRIYEMTYKGVSAFRQEVLKDGKWRKVCWYRFNAMYKPHKMDLREFCAFLEEIDRQRPGWR